jgi:SanA protein
MRFIKKLLVFFVVLLISAGILINYVMGKGAENKDNKFVSKEFAIVLGASVHGNELSQALKGRMKVAIELYKRDLVKSILLSGDGTNEYYSGVPQEKILTDEKGYNTYSTMLRAHDVFNAKSAYIITQDFHLARAVWVAKECGIDAQGVSAGRIKDPWYYYLREFVARVKDYIQVKLKWAFY